MLSNPDDMTAKEELECVLDDLFPKGNPNRGNALVLFAHAVRLEGQARHLAIQEAIRRIEAVKGDGDDGLSIEDHGRTAGLEHALLILSTMLGKK